MFSFYPYGACPACSGLGISMEIDPELIIPDKEKSIAEGAIAPWNNNPEGYYYQMLCAVMDHFGASVDTRKDLPKKVVDAILYGFKEKIEFHFNSRFSKKDTIEVISRVL